MNIKDYSLALRRRRFQEQHDLHMYHPNELAPDEIRLCRYTGKVFDQVGKTERRSLGDLHF